MSTPPSSSVAPRPATRQTTWPPAPWAALVALCLGFFMILLDGTIVSVATPTLVRSLHTDVNTVVWVTSSYLLAFAVPLMITGRLGDRFGPKRVYLIGMAVFVLASLACGLAASVQVLIAARVAQGLGGALMSPQTMSVITRIFPAERRGTAMGVWGAVAGLAGVGGPVLGGLLISPLGWQAVFFVNLPIGVAGLVFAWRVVPDLPTHGHRFDLVGVALSAVAMFCLTYAIQEGPVYHWGRITGLVSIPALLAAGVILLAVFAVLQACHSAEPLIPPSLFRARNFTLASIAVAMLASCNNWGLPFMLYAQSDRGSTVLTAALLLVPSAVISGLVSPLAGRHVTRLHPVLLAGTGLGAIAASLVLLAVQLSPTTPLWALLLIIGLNGVGNGVAWTSVSAIASAALPPTMAGAGSGVYNTMRSLGAAIGAAGIGAVMQTRLTAEPAGPAGHATAMGQSLLFFVAMLLIALAAAAALRRAPDEAPTA
ncbi:DHA2 family efflux MFS transporter permease subunit [Actinoallomurus sp. CA-150999]|uniref:DHA2 family efflux MFS transporter permease subunit n=1 Tax=Actinoallomurus sp. CA-150999 TaxID=3239887 RepID=UPI003D8FC7CF